MSNSLPTPVASMQVTLKTGDQRTKCLPEPDAALHNTKNKNKIKTTTAKTKRNLPEPDAAPHNKRNKNQIKTTTARRKQVYLSQMLLYMDLKVLASSREGGVAPWAVHLFIVISLFFFKDFRSIHCTPSSCFDISFKNFKTVIESNLLILLWFALPGHVVGSRLP